MLHLHKEEEADASSGGLRQEAETLGEDKTAVWMFTCPRGCRNDEHEDENKTYLGHIGKPESRPRLCKKHFITVLKRKRRMMKGSSSALGRINGRLHHQQLLHASLIPEGGRSVITAAGSLTRALG